MKIIVTLARLPMNTNFVDGDSDDDGVDDGGDGDDNDDADDGDDADEEPKK